MPPTSPLKRLSGGRLRRLLASLRPPTATGPLPVQTGFPTSLADIVVKNHGRLRNPRRRHRATGPPPVAAADAEQRRERSVADQDAAATVAVAARRPGRGAGAGGFSIRPGLLAAGGAVALVLLVVWSRQLVAAATVASVALYGVEYARTARPRRPETEKELVVDSLTARCRVSPILEAAESDDGVNDDGNSGDLGCDDTSSSSVNTPVLKLKQRRRSLRKLLATKLPNGKTRRSTDTRHAGDAGEDERPETPTKLKEEPAAPAEETATPAAPPEAITDDDRCQRHSRRGGALPLPALVPIILAGLVAGKLPALALAVLCAAFSSSVERVPADQQGSR